MGKPIKLGNSELVPVDGLTDFSSPANSQPGKPMNIDAVDKMVTTHLQHNTQPRRPVSLPEFSQPLDNFRGATTRSNYNNFAPTSRQITSRRPTITAVRKQPVQFFNKFDDGGLDNSQQLQQQDGQQPPTFTSSQSPRQGKATTLDNNFGSFPSRSSQSSLPSRQTVSRPPVQQQQQQQQPSEQLPSFTRFTSNQQSQTQQLSNFQPQQQNSFQPQQQQNSFQSQQPQQKTRFQPQQQQTRFQPQQQQTRVQPQQQQTPQFQPQQQTQSVEEAYKAQQEGIQRVLRQQAEVLALQQRPPTLQHPQTFQQPQPFQQPQTFQQPQLQPQVPGLQQHQAQLNKHLAVEIQHNV